jgi:sulfonate transport system permease protein
LSVASAEIRLTELTAGRAARVERRRPTIPRWIERLAGVVLLVALWQIASSAGWVNRQTLAGPIDVWRTGWAMATGGTLGSAMWVSLGRVVRGLAIGIPIATALALCAGLWRLGEDIVDGPMQMLRFLPIIGLQPLILLWFGIGDAAKISLIVFAVIFPIYINTFAAIRALDPGHLELAKTVGLGKVALVRRVVLPGAMPGFLTGLRLAVAVSWLILVFAEQINATNGIGYLMIKAQQFFQTDIIVVCLAVYALLGLASDALVRLLERRLLAWHPSR